MAEFDPEWVWIVCSQIGGCASIDGEADDAHEELIRPTNIDRLQMAEKHSNKRMAIFDAFIEIRDIIGECSSKDIHFHTEPKVYRHAGDLYEAIVDAIQELLSSVQPPKNSKCEASLTFYLIIHELICHSLKCCRSLDFERRKSLETRRLFSSQSSKRPKRWS